jgi:hypothetical protein
MPEFWKDTTMIDWPLCRGKKLFQLSPNALSLQQLHAQVTHGMNRELCDNAQSDSGQVVAKGKGHSTGVNNFSRGGTPV